MTTISDRIVQQVRGRAMPPLPESVSMGVFGTDPGVAALGDYLATSNDVYSVAWTRAKMQAKLPWYAKDAEGMNVDESHPLMRLLNRPNRHFTGLKLKLYLDLCSAMWGEAVIVTEGVGRPRELWPVKPTLIDPVGNSQELITHYLFRPPSGGTPIRFELDEVIWLSYPDPNDPSMLKALAPMGAARLAADTAQASQESNRNLFRQGMMAGGFVFPPEGASMSRDQAIELEGALDRRTRGVDKAHRFAVFEREFKLQQMNVSPKDAQFIQGMNMSFRQVCRAMGVPPALVGDAEYATLANLRVYERLFWEQTGEFNAMFVGEEFTRQLAPRFGVAEIGLSLDDVVALQEDETEKWSREKGQIELGVLTINEWREEQGLEPVEWGDTFIAPNSYSPIDQRSAVLAGRTPEGGLYPQSRTLDRETSALEEELRDQFARQRDDVIRRLKANEAEPFDKTVWDEKIAVAVEPHVLRLLEAAYDEAADQIRSRDRNDLRRKATLRAGELAGQLNTTTFKELRLAMRKSLDAGETAEELQARVDEIMERARKRRARLAAEVEANGARTDGRLEAWGIPGLVVRKKWVTAGDEKVRSTHAQLDGQTLALDEFFQVGECVALGPSRSGCAGEDINCRCVIAPVLGEPRSTISSDDMATVAAMLTEVTAR